MIDIALLVARLFLAAVFLVAGMAKLADLDGSRKAMRAFGVPSPLVAPLGTLLPLAELAVAAALVPLATAWWGAVGALALLLIFVAGIGANLARSNQPDCHCFGQLHSEPVGRGTLIRNGALAGIAGFVAWAGYSAPGASVIAWADHLTIAEGVVLGVAMLAIALAGVTGWAVLLLIGQNGRLLVRLEALESASVDVSARVATDPEASGLPIGAPAPAFSLAGVHGETTTLNDLRATEKPVLLVFADPVCSPCNALLPEIGHWQREHAAQLSLAVVTRGTPEANLSKSAEHGVTQVLLQHDREVATAYRANGTPAAVLMLPDGTIGSTLANGVEEIRSLVRSATTIVEPRQTMPLRQVTPGDGQPHSPGTVAIAN